LPYFDDLTPYSKLLGTPKRVRVGWLDGDHPFERGDSLVAVIGRIEEMCMSPLRRTRGWHGCPFCKEYPITHRLRSGRQIALGDAEIEVETNDIIYASPTLILHYMTVHQYKPPDAFLKAILRQTT
jgi:hypothetical protein